MLFQQATANGSAKIAILGAGSMGTIIAEGIIRNKLVAASDIIATGHRQENLDRLALLGAKIEQDNKEAAKQADIVLLCIKPKDNCHLLADINSFIQGKLVISIVAATSISHLASQIGSERIIRAMPTANAMVDCSYTALCAGEGATEQDKRMAEGIFGSLGEFVYLKESLMTAHTVLAACTPALAAFVMRAVAKAADAFGYSEEMARKAVAFAFFGAALSVLRLGKSFEEIETTVASRGGLTAKGLEKAEELGLSKIITDVISSMLSRGKELEK